MNINDLKSAGQVASNTGVKIVVYGPPGSGKTPLVKTAPTPFLLAPERGLLTLRGENNIACYQPDTSAQMFDALDWWHHSREANQFETLYTDSASEFAEMVLREELAKKTKSGNEADGRRAYGEMALKVYAALKRIFDQPRKHAVIICKQTRIDEGDISVRWPGFPGNDLKGRVPHLFDIICHMDKALVPGQPEKVDALRTRGTSDILARSRVAELNDFEPPNIAALIAKVKAGT